MTPKDTTEIQLNVRELQVELKNTNSKVDEVCGIVSRIETKLDTLAVTKADRCDVEALTKKVAAIDKSQAVLIAKIGFAFTLMYIVVEIFLKKIIG